MVNTRSSDSNKENQNVKGESTESSNVTETGATDSQSMGDLLRTVQKMSEILSAQVEQNSQLAAQVARVSALVAEGQRGTGAEGAAGEAAPQHCPCAPLPADQVPSAVRHFAKPQDFDGSVPWLAFRSQFETIASVHRWSVGEKLGELIACLRGPALEVFAHLPSSDQNDYVRLMTKLEQRFGCGRQEPWFRTQFRQRRRHPGESLSTLARDIEKLVFQAYPDAPTELRDSLACDQFLDALGDADLQIAVRQARPSCLQDAFTGAMQIEAIRRSVKVDHTSSHSSSGFASRQAHGDVDSTKDGAKGDFGQRLRAIEQSLRMMEMREKPGNPSPRPGLGEGVQCWSCGQRGHVRRFCTQRRMSQKQGAADRSGNAE